MPISALIALATMLTTCTEQTVLPELVSEAPYAADSGTLLIHCGALIDGVSDGATGPVFVLVEDGRVKLLASAVESAAGIAMLDLSDKTCLKPDFRRRPVRESA